MGFKEAKRAFLQALVDDNIIHEYRTIEEKNWIASQQISLEEAREILGSVRGNQAECGRHHFLAVEIWVFKPIHSQQRWYVKGYLIEGTLHVMELHLMSFHPSERSQS